MCREQVGQGWAVKHCWLLSRVVLHQGPLLAQDPPQVQPTHQASTPTKLQVATATWRLMTAMGPLLWLPTTLNTRNTTSTTSPLLHLPFPLTCCSTTSSCPQVRGRGCRLLA